MLDISKVARKVSRKVFIWPLIFRQNAILHRRNLVKTEMFSKIPTMLSTLRSSPYRFRITTSLYENIFRITDHFWSETTRFTSQRALSYFLFFSSMNKQLNKQSSAPVIFDAIVMWQSWVVFKVNFKQCPQTLSSMEDPAGVTESPWWRHQMETFSALLALCEGNQPATGEFPSQRPVTRSFDDLFDLRLNKRLSKQSWSR